MAPTKTAPAESTQFLVVVAVLAILLVAVEYLDGRTSLADTEAATSARAASEPFALSDESPVLGIDAILARIPDASRAGAGRGARLGLVESSTALLEKEKSPQLARRIGSRSSAHLVAVREAARRLAPGAVIAPASFQDEADDVARYARAAAADAVTLTFTTHSDSGRTAIRGRSHPPIALATRPGAVSALQDSFLDVTPRL